MDQSWAWCAVVAGSINNFLCMGLLRSGGIIFISAVETFQSTRTKAAWIPMISISTMFLTAPVSTAMARHSSFHLVVGLGGTIAFLGMLICYFASQIEWLMIGWGVVYGLGSSFVFFPSVAAVGRYFQRWRPLGTGLVLAGGGIGSFCLSPFLEHLIDQYRMKGAILILCGIVMNFWVTSLLFMLVATCERNHKRQMNKLKETTPLKQKHLTQKIVGEYTVKSEALLKNNDPQHHSSPSDQSPNSGATISTESNLNCGKESVIPTSNGGQYDLTSAKNKGHNTDKSEPIYQIESEVVIKTSSLNKSSSKMLKSLISSFDPSVIKNRKFIINSICNAFQTSIFMGTIILLPDFCEDEIGLTRIEGAYFVSVTAISDLCLRLFISWLMSKVNVPKEWATVIVSLVYAISLTSLGYSWTYSMVMINSVVLGGCLAIGTQLYFEILAKCQAPEKYTMAVGFSEMSKAVTTVGIASFLGSLKDATGSYAMTFHLLTALMLLSMLLWLIEIYLAKKDEDRNNKSQV